MVRKSDGVRHRLGPDKEDAEREFHRLMLLDSAERVDPKSMAAIIDKFLEWTDQEQG